MLGVDGVVAPDGSDGIDGLDGTTAARAVVASRQTATRSVSTTVRVLFLDMLSSSIKKILGCKFLPAAARLPRFETR